MHLKQTLKRVPGLRPASLFIKDQLTKQSLRNKTPEEVFTKICREKKWSAGDSVSGTGSDLKQTQVIRDELQKILHEYAIASMLDIPCGDFHWMKHVPLNGADYIGADIVPDLIDRNRQFELKKVHFRQLNLIQDELPTVDLIFCRDCLVHLSYQDALTAIQNICNSGSTYLLTTTFPQTQRNQNIATGQWRMINLELAPFSFPNPLKVVSEQCSEGEAYKDKSLGLWSIQEIRNRLIRY